MYHVAKSYSKHVTAATEVSGPLVNGVWPTMSLTVITNANIGPINVGNG